MKLKYVIACAFLLLGACSESTKTAQKESANESKIYSSDSLHFSISHPANWDVKEKGSKVGIVESNPDSNDVYKENIVVWVEEMPLAISDSLYAKATLAELRIKNPSLEIHSLPSLKFGDHSFSHFEFDLPGEGRNYKVVGYTTVEGKRGYNFSCTYEASATEDYKKQFESIIQTFKSLP